MPYCPRAFFAYLLLSFSSSHRASFACRDAGDSDDEEESVQQRRRQLTFKIRSTIDAKPLENAIELPPCENAADIWGTQAVKPVANGAIPSLNSSQGTSNDIWGTATALTQTAEAERIMVEVPDFWSSHVVIQEQNSFPTFFESHNPNLTPSIIMHDLDDDDDADIREAMALVQEVSRVSSSTLQTQFPTSATGSGSLPLAIEIPAAVESKYIHSTETVRWIASDDFTEADRLLLASSTGSEPQGFSFCKGAELEVLEKTDSGWWFARLGSKEGWIPSTFLKEHRMVPDDDDDLPPLVMRGTASADSNIIASSFVTESKSEVTKVVLLVTEIVSSSIDSSTDEAVEKPLCLVEGKLVLQLQHPLPSTLPEVLRLRAPRFNEVPPFASHPFVFCKDGDIVINCEALRQHIRQQNTSSVVLLTYSYQHIPPLLLIPVWDCSNVDSTCSIWFEFTPPLKPFLQNCSISVTVPESDFCEADSSGDWDPALHTVQWHFDEIQGQAGAVEARFRPASTQTSSVTASFRINALLQPYTITSVHGFVISSVSHRTHAGAYVFRPDNEMDV